MVARCWGRFDGPMSGQLPATRATIKALPTPPNRTRPYGSSGLLPVFMA